MIYAGPPTWEQATPEQRDQYRGNTDPWAGPVDPRAHARALALARRDQRNDPTAAAPCGCWAADCGECGPRHADGQRPPKGAQRRWALRQDAALQQAKERHHEAQQAVTR